MAHHDDVGVHRLERERGVVEGFALFHAAAAAGHIDDVGAEYLARLLERYAGARARFVEQGDDGFAAQGGDFLDVAAQHFAHCVGVLQN